MSYSDRYKVTTTILRFYAGITGRTFESVRDEYLGKPPPGRDKYYVDNKLFTHVKAAVAQHYADATDKNKEGDTSEPRPTN